MKRKVNTFDFTDCAVEITGDALYLINGGAEIENSYEAQARANPGDTVTDSNGVQHTLWQGDIDYAQKLTGITGQSAGSSTAPSQPTSSGSSAGNQDNNRTAGEGTTLWEKYGANRQELSGSTRGAKTSQVGERAGKKEYHDLWESVSQNNVYKPIEQNKSSNTVYQAGVGLGCFLVGGLSFECGISYSKKEGFDVYRTFGLGFGVGVTGDATLGANISDYNTNLHNSTGNVAVIGTVINTNYDLTNNAKITGLGGFGFGGGVLWTWTRTLKGDIEDIINAFGLDRK